ncbi:hypothetical protein XA68_14257 [Ophiocordyceps unilateralis]|uniref:Protein kinase domain-containing protein n=1 Tax=Ophiocordyceps unilateralis TaxID=268505 RepID=A0A2A9P923_OPHUN|nr:hypothetical protein XA68_14257 [Ophiocordyceps unilateralis]
MAVAIVHSCGFVHGDIHLGNILVNLPSTFNKLSADQLRERFGEPEMIAISRVDRNPLPPNVPSHAVASLYLGKKAQEFTLTDAQGLILSDFGEAFAPATEQRLGKHCNTPLARRAPEALFEPNAPLSFPSDIWSLAIAIWDILGMKSIFSESETRDEIAAQQIDVLGPEGFPATWRKIWERLSTEETNPDQGTPRQPTGHREVWPPLEDAFTEFVQKYRRRREAAGTFSEEETRAILDMMRGMLKFRPEERLTIDEVLGSEWSVQLEQLRGFAAAGAGAKGNLVDGEKAGKAREWALFTPALNPRRRRPEVLTDVRGARQQRQQSSMPRGWPHNPPAQPGRRSQVLSKGLAGRSRRMWEEVDGSSSSMPLPMSRFFRRASRSGRRRGTNRFKTAKS